MSLLGERQVVVDCDVIQADGGTRTASICGGYLALHDALTRRVQQGLIASHPLHSTCAAISVGIVDGVPVLDLPYVEDSRAEVDMNVVMLRPLASEAKLDLLRCRAPQREWHSLEVNSIQCSCSQNPGSPRLLTCKTNSFRRRLRLVHDGSSTSARLCISKP